MRRIAIIGSGQAGLLAAHGLVRAGGYEVTLYSDRTADQWLNESRPTGTAARFDMALAYERELELNHWEKMAPNGEGVHLTFCPEVGNRLLTVAGRLDRPFQAIDLRLQSHRWMHDLEARGGRIIIEKVDTARLDAIAAAHDLTIVAVGRGDLWQLFERDAERSVYDRPQRNLAMICAAGGRLGFDGIPYLPVKFNFFGPVGEAFWVPYYHKDVGPSWNLLFEAKPGGPMDRFGAVKTGEEALEVGKEVIRDLIPWDYAWVKDMRLSDPLGWLVGKVQPTVRKPVGRLPSGRFVTALGDTAMSLDPVAGQGANNGNKMARNLVESIIAHGDRPFDEAWMTETFERFFERHGKHLFAFTNMLLEPITAAAQELLIAQYGCDGTHDDGRQHIADTFIRNFNDPREYNHLFMNVPDARAYIAEVTGRSWVWSAVSGRLRIGREQIRQKLGGAPRHPLALQPHGASR